VCRGCGSVAEAPPSVAASLVAELRGSYGFDADVPHLTVFGTCATCRERREATGGDGG
jgi:Fur family ferric uptake transcriptional regulator